MSQGRTTEKEWIEGFMRSLGVSRRAVLGIGDDAAVLRQTGSREDTLLTADMLIEDRHFRLREASAYEIGWKAIAVNISDIAAMGGIPTFAVVSLGLKPTTPKTFVNELYRGMRTVSKRFGLEIVGGDTNASDKLILAVTMLGRVARGGSVTRRGAKPADAIFVTGPLGGSYRSGKHLSFLPRVKEAQFLTHHFKVNAMMDISDGLSSDLYKLTEASGVGALLFGSRIPLSRGVRCLENALNDGEDFELLFTLSQCEAVKLMRSAKLRRRYRWVGLVTHQKNGVKLLESSGRITILKERGFDHFRRRG